MALRSWSTRLGGGSQLGVTLVELMVTLVVASVLMSGMLFGVNEFFRQFNQQMEYATAQHTGRVVIDILRHHVRQTGWGFMIDDDAYGDVFVGTCFDDDGNQEGDCNNVDPYCEDSECSESASDRLRVIFGDHAGFQSYPGEEATAGGVPVSEGVSDPFPDGVNDDLVFISGECKETPPQTPPDINNKLAVGGTDGGPLTGLSGTYLHEFNYTPFDASGPTSCDNGYHNYHFGRLNIVDFKIDRTDPAHPTLLMRKDPRETWELTNESVMLVGRDIEDLQLDYGIDLELAGQPKDSIPDIWCDNPTSCGDPPDSENHNRIVAIRIAVVVRTSTYREKRDVVDDPPPTMQVFDSVIPDVTDGYRRWIFRTTISLRNNPI